MSSAHDAGSVVHLPPAMIYLFLAGGSRRLRLPRGPLRHNFSRLSALRLGAGANHRWVRTHRENS
jgi:hypothetical protein